MSNDDNSPKKIRHHYFLAVRTLLALQILLIVIGLIVDWGFGKDGIWFLNTSIAFPLFGILASFLSLKRNEISDPEEALLKSVGRAKDYDYDADKEFREVILVKLFYAILFFIVSGIGLLFRNYFISAWAVHVQ